MKLNRTKFPYRIYSNPIFNRMYVSYSVDKIEQKDINCQEIQ